ncbi:MAG: holo-[acyl-carrier-protein] synthase [Phycisphaerae bacterium]|nr:holo-[acyl-carrier-protein] synthase [Phycisphaerae bacterium]
MSVVAHGIDLCEVERIARMIERHGDRFLTRCFTAAELAYADASAKRRDEHLAARFAAKEAVLKAIGTGWSQGIAWTDVEVTRANSGAPGVQLTGRAAAIAIERGIERWSLSLSHAGGMAVASAIGLGWDGSRDEAVG